MSPATLYSRIFVPREIKSLVRSWWRVSLRVMDLVWRGRDISPPSLQIAIGKMRIEECCVENRHVTWYN